jgi:hypothetical protein
MHTTFNLADVLINVPKYAILIIVVPMLTLTVLKVWMTARASSKGKPKKEWVLSRQLDEEGIPLLAEATARTHRGAALYRASTQRRPRP